MVVLVAGSWCVNAVLSFAPHAYQELHDTRVWVPWDSAETEVRDFMEACHEHPKLIAHWPARLLTRHRLKPVWGRHVDSVRSLYLYNWTLDFNTQRELAFNCTFAAEPQSRPLTLEDYLLVASENRNTKQHGLARMLERGDISPERFRELDELLVQAFPDKYAYPIADDRFITQP